MNNLSNYISESNIGLITEAKTKGKITRSNAQRKEELIKMLQKTNYDKYVKVLNQMLKDPKAKTLLEDGFGGELADTKISCRERAVLAGNLIPTQNEVDVTKSLPYSFLWPDKNLPKYFGNEPFEINGMPLVTFQNYIIDGHHRWSQAVMFNPKAKMKSFDFDSDEILASNMLKAVQGSVAATAAVKGKKELPQATAKPENNIFKFSEKKLKDYIWNVLNGSVPAVGDKYVQDGGQAFIEELSKYVPEVKEAYGEDQNLKKAINTAVKYIWNNIKNELNRPSLPHDNPVERAIMPQTDMGGVDDANKKVGPDDEGSALNRAQDIVGAAVK